MSAMTTFMFELEFERIALLLLGLWLLPGVLTALILLGFIVKQLLRDRRSSDLADDAKLLLVALVLGFILLPLLIAAPLSGWLANRQQGRRRPSQQDGGEGGGERGQGREQERGPAAGRGRDGDGNGNGRGDRA